MKRIKTLIKKLKAFDVVVISFSIFLILLHIIFHSKIENSLTWIFINLVVISMAFGISYLEALNDQKVWRIIHYWYIAPIILLTFRQLFFMVKPIRVYDYDDWFIAIDRWMFGTDPTHFLYQFSNPVLTEILQVVYGMFYLLPIILCLSLLKKDRFVALDFALFSVIYGFFLSYLGYFSLPGIGPRFTLHDFNTINEMLPGLYLTNHLREMTNTGEGIPFGTLKSGRYCAAGCFSQRSHDDNINRNVPICKIKKSQQVFFYSDWIVIDFLNSLSMVSLCYRFNRRIIIYDLFYVERKIIF